MEKKFKNCNDAKIEREKVRHPVMINQGDDKQSAYGNIKVPENTQTTYSNVLSPGMGVLEEVNSWKIVTKVCLDF